MAYPSIGKYEIVGELGRGAMGIVFRALDPAIDRNVAIKVIRTPAFSNSDEIASLRMRLMREARAAGKLSHPNIVTVYSLDEQNDFLYVVMEFVEGQSLDQYIESGRLKQPLDAIPILRQIAEGLDYAHGVGIVHRDIKPANVLIGAGGRVKITDFGIAKIASQKVTHTGTTMGTPAYMSPEQIRAGDLNGRADQFSLAVVAFEMLTGRPPFDAPTYDALILKIATENAPLAHDVKASLPEECSMVLLKGLARSPEERFLTCTGFVDALAGSLVATPRPRTAPWAQTVAPPRQARAATVVEVATAPPRQTRAETVAEMQAAPPRRARWPLLLIAVLVLAGVAVGVWMLSGTRSSPVHDAKTEEPATPAPGGGSPVPGGTSPVPGGTSPVPSNTSPVPSDTTPVPRETSNEQPIRALIDNWAAAIRSRNIVGLRECYAPIIDFYGLRKVPRERGTNALARAFTMYNSISIQITNLTFKDVSENRATADFDKEWDFRGATNFAGSGRQEMRFIKEAGQWLISAETELGKPYWVRHPK